MLYKNKEKEEMQYVKFSRIDYWSCANLLSLEDEKISGQTFQTKQIVAIGTDLDLVGQAAVILSHDLVLEKQRLICIFWFDQITFYCSWMQSLNLSKRKGQPNNKITKRLL